MPKASPAPCRRPPSRGEAALAGPRPGAHRGARRRPLLLPTGRRHRRSRRREVGGHRPQGRCRRGRCRAKAQTHGAGLGQLELGGLVAHVDAAHAIPASLFGEHRKNAEVLELAGHPGLDHLRRLGDEHRVPDQLQQLIGALHAVVLVVQRLLEVLAVVERQVLHGDARAVRVVRIPSEGVCEKVHLEADGHHRPILEGEAAKQRDFVAGVGDILETEDVDGVQVELLLLLGSVLLLLIRRVRGLLLTLFLLGGRLLLSALRGRLLLGLGLVRALCGSLGGLLFRGRLLAGGGLGLGFLDGGPLRVPRSLLRGLLCHGGLVLVLLAVPRLQRLLPLLPSRVEPLARHQVLDSHCRLSLLHPLLDVLLGLRLSGPLEAHVVEALLLLRKGELQVRSAQHVIRQVRDRPLPEDHVLLLLGELHLRRLAAVDLGLIFLLLLLLLFYLLPLGLVHLHLLRFCLLGLLDALCLLLYRLRLLPNCLHPLLRLLRLLLAHLLRLLAHRG
mmetsp:Transcript_3865/g.11229  ORF Transcript_3865/g.11229 Transcript_3865/m.11229 type:complete len:502 (+) Transcript_3865:110-1615(+)